MYKNTTIKTARKDCMEISEKQKARQLSPLGGRDNKIYQGAFTISTHILGVEKRITGV